jgi:hypothetical protein
LTYGKNVRYSVYFVLVKKVLYVLHRRHDVRGGIWQLISGPCPASRWYSSGAQILVISVFD